jgi:hypothetical protein
VGGSGGGGSGNVAKWQWLGGSGWVAVVGWGAGGAFFLYCNFFFSLKFFFFWKWPFFSKFDTLTLFFDTFSMQNLYFPVILAPKKPSKWRIMTEKWLFFRRFYTCGFFFFFFFFFFVYLNFLNLNFLGILIIRPYFLTHFLCKIRHFSSFWHQKPPKMTKIGPKMAIFPSVAAGTRVARGMADGA